MRYTPAVTIVAAWMSADTGVGPSIASGSQMYSGSCALLPQAPMNSIIVIAVAVERTSVPPIAALFSVLYDSEPTAWNAKNIAIMKPQSPTRLVTKAFLPAVAALSRVCQKLMSRYEQVPTPSQPRKVTSMFSPRTSMSIEKANRLRYTKNFENFGSPCMYPTAYRWISVPMPVMNRAMVMLSGSARNAASTERPPTGIHEKTVATCCRASSGLDTRSK